MALADIQHFVVLMMENRSFDHLLGYVDLPNSDNLLHGGPYTADAAAAGSPPVPVTKTSGAPPDFISKPDPLHEYINVTNQIFGQGKAPPSPPTMRGFVQSYVTDSGGKAEDVMRCFRPSEIPAIATLAQNFVVCDRWFSSMPSSTWPNRYFAHAATSLGYVDISNAQSLALLAGATQFNVPTIFNRIDSAGKDWRVYFHNPPQVSTLTQLVPTFDDKDKWREFDPGNTLPGFAEDVANNDLPFYTFIEPQFDPFAQNNLAMPDNSGHPSGDFRRAQQLIREVYNSLRASDLWHSTMLIVVFDEHGGFYDHVVPPTAPAQKVLAPDASTPNVPGFHFDRLGPRVPALVISPWVKKGFVDHGPQCDTTPRPDRWYDHTSIIATVLRALGQPPLTARDGHAFDLLHLIGDDWRHDCVISV